MLQKKSTGGNDRETWNSSGDEIPERVTSLYVATLLRLTPPTDRFPWDDLRKILLGGQISRHSFSKLSGPTEL